MIIDFDKIAEEHIEGFKGGEGKLDMRAYVDDKTRIMYSTLRPGASSGRHQHTGTFEAMYVLSGELTVHYDEGRCIIVRRDISTGSRTGRTTMLSILPLYRR